MKKIAICHDYLNQFGGAERVLKAFLEIFPQADVFALFGSKKIIEKILEGKKVHFSFLNRFPLINQKHRFFIPLMPFFVKSLNLKNYEIVLSSASSFIKGVETKGVHFCYCHTPTRYLWEEKYLLDYPLPDFLKKFFKLPVYFLRKIDFSFSKKPDFFIANSNFIAKKIEKFYQRKAEVIYPPYDEKKFFYDKMTSKENFYLMVGRLLYYKRFDLAIETFNQLKLPLIVVGKGPEEKKLKKMAKENIKFLGFVSDEKLRKLYQKAKALIFPQIEDFGIVPLEAMACGTPVIAFNFGGQKESIIENFSGVFFEKQTKESLIQAIEKFEKIEFDFEKISKYAQKFSKERFKKEIKEFIEKNLK